MSKVLGALLVVVLLVAAGWWSLRGGEERPALRARIEMASSASESPQGFARATAPRAFSFPEDHGPHPAYRTEWWYVTGNVATGDGRQFGFQLTFFRFALAPGRAARASRWATNQVYMAHLALTDVAAGVFHSAERFSRAALGLAGAQPRPFRVWLEDWQMGGSGQHAFPMRLQAGQKGFGLDITLQARKPVVLQGDHGLSRKSSEAGNASYYYSATRMPAAGHVRVGGQEYAVSGLAWLDREWGTSALGPEQTGWDWFALQLDDGRDLMYYRLRRRDGTADPHSAGTLVAPDGDVRRLGPGDVRLEVLDHWKSPVDGAVYPARWRLRVPEAGLSLEIVPKLADQEMRHSVRYWEGAVSVRGLSADPRAAGAGYVELTGYANTRPPVD
jgi:predicted secreted hydrolase